LVQHCGLMIKICCAQRSTARCVVDGSVDMI
jgi:hypothetical protein